MSKKIWIAAISAVLAVGVGVGSVIAFGSVKNDGGSARSTIGQEDHNRIEKELWNDFSEDTSKYYNELKDNSEYASIDDKYIKNSIIDADARYKAQIDYDNILIDLLKSKNMIVKDFTYENMINTNDHTKYYDYLRALCRLYSDTDIYLTSEEIVRIEIRLKYAHNDLYDEKDCSEIDYNEEEVMNLQKTIRDTTGLEEPDPNITH